MPSSLYTNHNSKTKVENKFAPFYTETQTTFTNKKVHVRIEPITENSRKSLFSTLLLRMLQ